MKRIFLIFTMVWAVACGAIAQKTAAVKSFTQTTDHIPSAERRKDLNGNYCALIKIQVVDDIERVEGNKIGNIVKRGVEKWVYMCKGSRNIRVHLKNHLPVKVVFQDYKINGLESNRVYELVLEIPDAPNVEQPVAISDNSAQQKLTLNYIPEHAMVLIDSKPYRGNGKIELQLPVGEHDYIIAAEGYITAEATVKLTEYAPRVITEVLAVDNSFATVAGNHEKQPVSPPKNVKNTKPAKKPKKDKKPARKPKKEEKTIVETTDTNVFVSGREPQNEEHNIKPSKTVVSPKTNGKAKALNKSFSYTYNGVVFKCKVKNNTATIFGFDVKATDVTIPAQVIYDNTSYPVTIISTHLNGNNYSVKRLVIPEGVEVIEKFSFSEFRKLESVTIPNSVVRIGKNAFRNNPATKFNMPVGIDESKLRSGKEILTR